MKSKDRIVIQKMIKYIRDIEDYVGEMDAIEFMEDNKTISACAFAVSQIGELVTEISGDTVKKYSQIPWRSIKGMRNKIVHDYENVDLSVLWSTIKESLPELKEELANVLLELKD